MKKLSPIKSIISSVLETPCGRQKTIGDSVDFILRQHDVLSRFSGPDELALTASERPNEKILHACCKHLMDVRSALAQQLWARHIFIGISVLDQLVYSALRNKDAKNPVADILRDIQRRALHNPGFVLYPLHSLGVLGCGLDSFFSENNPFFPIPEYGMSISPQTNSLDKTTSFIEQSCRRLNINRTADKSLFTHWLHTRDIKWFIRNPLLLLKFHSVPGSYYENQYFLEHMLQFSTTALCMMNVLQGDNPDAGTFSMGSSANCNNYETLDLKHYLVFYPDAHKKHLLTGDCVPYYGPQFTFTEVSNLPIDLDPRSWSRRSSLVKRITLAIKALEKGYFSSQSRRNIFSRVHQKIVDALGYFRRSFYRQQSPSESIVNLAIAFEALLMDQYYKKNNTVKFYERIRLSLRHIRGCRALEESVKKLYEIRGAIVHKGRSQETVDLQVCRKAFVFSFLQVVEHLHNMPKVSSEPIYEILQKI